MLETRRAKECQRGIAGAAERAKEGGRVPFESSDTRLGACNTPNTDRKKQIPQPLVNTGVLALRIFRKNSENRRLTTSLTTTAETA